MTQPIPKATFTLRYIGKDISRDIAPLCRSLTYTDRLDQQAPDLSISLNDPNLLFLGDWFPQVGDSVSLTIQYEDGEVLDAGAFQFDQIDSAGPPNRVSLKFTATDITEDLRTNKSEAYENTTLAEIAQTVADRHNLEVVGTIPEISFERETQNEKTDLEFISELAANYGLLVKVENDKLVFHSWEELDAADPVATLRYRPDKPDRRSEIRSYRLSYKSRDTYKEATVSGTNPDTGEVIEESSSDEGVGTGDSLVLTERVESPQQAKARAAEELRKANAQQTEGSFVLYQGRSDAVAGTNWRISGFGRFDGKWQASEAQHTLDARSGWNCTLKLRKIETIVGTDETAET